MSARVRPAPRWVRILRKRWRRRGDRARVDAEVRALAALRASPWFDAEWYLATYPDVGLAGHDPAAHFLRHGAPEGRDPGPRFSTAHYLEHYPDVAASGLNPLEHFLRVGEAEGRAPHPMPPPPPPALVVPGSAFAHFATDDPLAIMRLIASMATPAERLARAGDGGAAPLISILCPTYDTPVRYLREAIQSIQAQTYAHWELCLVDDGSTAPDTLAVLDELARGGDPRIRIHRRPANGGIAAASQDALAAATGDYVAFVDHDDLLTPNALSEVVAAIRADPSLDYIYTDHANVGPDGLPRHHSRKPGWSPEFLLATNYIVHFKVVRRALLLAIGGLADEVAGAQDLGMSCRLAAANARVGHVPAICYLWREAATSVASGSAAKPGIEDRLVEVYDRHLAALGSTARQAWPNRYRATRTGVFRPVFGAPVAPVTLLAIVRGPGETREAIRERLLPAFDKTRIDLRLIAMAAAPGLPEGTQVLADDAALLDLLQSIATEQVVFVNATARHIGIDWLAELSGFLSLDRTIAAVGGKALDPWLRVRGAGALIDDDGRYRMIGGGADDYAGTHWFTGEIASNVDALPTWPLAARREALLAAGGLRLLGDGDAAGVAFSEAARAAGMRLVYNPAAALVDPARVSLPGGMRRRLEAPAPAHPPRLYAGRVF